ncbi:hypothetical protein BDN67DRAFT_1003474 [Paxillus ammoniavirescens]|nr:hypothetical protein BDN67DRAFT_1003474 [Paxillus ammoniavirescens]
MTVQRSNVQQRSAVPVAGPSRNDGTACLTPYLRQHGSSIRSKIRSPTFHARRLAGVAQASSVRETVEPVEAQNVLSGYRTYRVDAREHDRIHDLLLSKAWSTGWRGLRTY